MLAQRASGAVRRPARVQVGPRGRVLGRRLDLRVSNEPLHGRRLSDAPHLHSGTVLLLPAGTVGAVCGAAIKHHHQADGGQDQNQQQDDGGQAHRQQEVRGQIFRGQLEGHSRSQVSSWELPGVLWLQIKS